MFTRDQLRCKALLALDEICDSCGAEPAPPSFMLRFTLAWLFQESGADPAKQWIFTAFWIAATRPRAFEAHDQLVDDYCRGTGARSALNAICRAIGMPADVEMDQMMRDARAGAGAGGRGRSGLARPARGHHAHKGEGPVG